MPLIASDRLTRLSDSELLELRLRDVAYDIGDHSDLVVACGGQLRRDLQRVGLVYVQPTLYVGDEWFTPDRMSAIAVPFYLMHPRLVRLERSQMGEVEGGGPRSCLKLLRHEAGHCFDHAYGISDRADFKRVFGEIGTYDPDRYLFDPLSSDFVVHLGQHYAQAHPFEDFAECFAVVISPEIPWRRLYRARPRVMAKLSYVADMIVRLRGRRPRTADGTLPFAAKRLTRTLARHYELRARLAGKSHFAYFDADLERVFADHGRESASTFLESHAPQLVHRAASLVSVAPGTARQLLRRLTTRCRQLDLKVDSPRAALADVEDLMITSLQSDRQLRRLAGHTPPGQSDD